MIESTREKLEGLDFTHLRSQYNGLPQEYMILQDRRITLIMKKTGSDVYLAHRGEDVNGTNYSESEMNCDLFDLSDDITVQDLIKRLKNPDAHPTFKGVRDLKYLNGLSVDITGTLGI